MSDKTEKKTETAVEVKKPTAVSEATKNAMTARKEVAILTRLADESPDGLVAQIAQMSGDPMFTRKFVQCVKNAVTKAWKKGYDGKWTNPFQVVPLNSVLDCLWKCAERRILPDGYNAYLVCYCGKNPTCQLLIDYKGMIDTAVKEGIIIDGNADVVCENDEFVWNCGEVERWTFDFRKPRGKVCGACAWVVLPNGRKKWAWVDLEELTKIRGCVRDTSIWDTWTREMYKKTAIRRIFKTTRNTPAMSALMEADNEAYDLDKPSERNYGGDTPVRKVVGTQSAGAIGFVGNAAESGAEAAEVIPDAAPVDADPVTVEADVF